MRRLTTGCCVLLAMTGCTSGSLNHALGTPKNPTPAFADPAKDKDPQIKFIEADYGVLLMAIDAQKQPLVLKKANETTDMRRYIAAGFDLADFYCKRYFDKTDEAYRRRRFGRTLTNDVGTAVTTILGLASAGESAVTALAAVTGFGDSVFRNYDDSFVVTPDLANVRGLVLAAQDNFRARTLAKDVTPPADFGTAQTTIRRYADLCSFLGMKAMLDQSATKQQSDLKTDTEARNGTGKADGAADDDGAAEPTPAAETTRPAVAVPALAPNAPSER